MKTLVLPVLKVNSYSKENARQPALFHWLVEDVQTYVQVDFSLNLELTTVWSVTIGAKLAKVQLIDVLHVSLVSPITELVYKLAQPILLM
jgi:hypothetical protein